MYTYSTVLNLGTQQKFTWSVFFPFQKNHQKDKQPQVDLLKFRLSSQK